MVKRFLVGVALAGIAVVAASCGGESAPPAEEAAPPDAAPAPAPAPAAETPASEPDTGALEAESAEGASEEATPADVSDVGPPVVEMSTSLGTLRIELSPKEAPRTVENFLTYVRDGFYDGTIFHRVVPGFVIQGGGFTADMTEKETRPPIENEANNGLRNLRGTICMARTQDPHSATSQFFVNAKDNPALDFRDESIRGWGYAVFGRVVEGIDVVEAIEKVERTRKGMYDDVPVEPVIIESVRLISGAGAGS